MGYMILPWEAIDRMLFAMESINLSVPVLLQRALALFLQSGQLEHHIYKMKRLYAKKRLLLIKELKGAFGEKIRISGENAGMHLMVNFENRPLCREDFEKLRACRAEAEWSEDYAVQKGIYESGMILGYGALSEEEIKMGVEHIKAAFWNV
jgi:GntR family transcriptional regulator/MocR family aminotransferase